MRKAPWLMALLCAGCSVPPPATLSAEICVYGATFAGVTAAVQAARDGRSVVLIDADGWVGGLTTAGLGATDVGVAAAVGGATRDFYRALREHYRAPSAWTWQRAADFRGRGHEPGGDAVWTFEPGVAGAQLGALLAGAGIAPLRDRLDRAAGGVEKRGASLVAIRLESGRKVAAIVFLDCSYEGDLMAAAGCSYAVGREGNAAYGETLNGVQTGRARAHQFDRPVDPYVRPGDSSSGLLPGIAAAPGEEGAADGKVQAYCFRVCATDVADNRVPWPKPDGYDERDHELLLRWFDAGARMRPWHPVQLPNGKTDSNNNGAVSSDWIGGNWNYPEASYQERRAIADLQRRYQQGLLWTLANHPRVPLQVRRHFQEHGLCRDEFAQHVHWPPLLYVREARRLRGELVVTEQHCLSLCVEPDPVGLGSYTMDSHHVQRHVALGAVRNEGDFQVPVPAPYGISYRALLPRRAECDNLLVPVCLSASHVAYGSIRMEPVLAVLAQSAAIAADLALDLGLPVHDVPWPQLQERLLAAGQVLALPPAPR